MVRLVDGELVPIPDEVSDLPHPLLSPIRRILPSIGRRALGQPAFARQLHAGRIRPDLAWLPDGFLIALETIPSPVGALVEGDKGFGEAVTGRAMVFRQCRVSRLAVMVDPSKQAQALAREPDHVVVELFSHLFVIHMPVSAMEPIP